MQDEYCVGYVAVRIALRSADCGVMHANLGKRFDIRKGEILRDEVAFLQRHGGARRGLLSHGELRRAANEDRDREYRLFSCEHSSCFSLRRLCHSILYLR